MKDVLSIFTFAIGALFLVAFFSTLKPAVVTAAVGGMERPDGLQLEGFAGAGLPNEQLCRALVVRCSNDYGRSRPFVVLSLTFTAETLLLNTDTFRQTHMTIAVESSGAATIRRMLAGLLLLSSILASSDATADLKSDSPGLGPAQQEKNTEPDQRFLALFRAAPLSLTQAIAVVERLHLASRTAAVIFEMSERPGYRVRTVKGKEIWENVVDVLTGLVAGPETSWTLNELEMEERDNINALRLVKQELSDAVAIAEKAAAGKAISGGLVKEGDKAQFRGRRAKR